MSAITKRSGRFSILIRFDVWFLTVSLLLRIIFFKWQYDQASWHLIDIFRTLFTGLFFDIGTIAFISLPAVIYCIILPNNWVGSPTDSTDVEF